MPRHGDEKLIENTNDFYEEFFEKRNLTKITHYATPKLPKLTAEIRSKFVTGRHVWKQGDKFHKLASQYYGDPKLWWVIAWFNKVPNEGMLKSGKLLLIPQPLTRILDYFNFGVL